MLIVPIIALYNPIDDTILLSVRQTGKQLAGFYEFPGGKTEVGELPSQALCREIYEELDIHIKVTDLTPVTFTDFHFENKAYVLCMYYCDTYTGKPIGKEGQKIEFIALDRLNECKMPPANRVMIPILQNFIKLN